MAESAENQTLNHDPHGQAALLLVESLIHGLVGKSVLTVEDALSVMEIALESQVAVTDDSRPRVHQSQRLLTDMMSSMQVDLRR